MHRSLTFLATLALLLACAGSGTKDGLTKAAEACDQACTDPAQGSPVHYVGGMLCGERWTCRCALPGEPEASVCDPIVRVGVISDTSFRTEPVVTYAGEAAAQMAAWSPHLLAHAGNLIPPKQPDPAGLLGALLSAYDLPGVPRLLALGWDDVYPGLPSMDTLRGAYPLEVTSWLEPGQMFGSMDLRGVHFVVLDQTYQVLEPATHTGLASGTWNLSGYIPQVQRDWLAADLAATALPTVVFVHAGTGIADPGWEPFELGNAADLTALFEAHKGKIAAVVGGYHRNLWARVNGINYFVVSTPVPKYPLTPHDRGGHAQLELDTEQRTVVYTVWENDSSKGYLEVRRLELPF